jgi:hypothetical protein
MENQQTKYKVIMTYPLRLEGISKTSTLYPLFEGTDEAWHYIPESNQVNIKKYEEASCPSTEQNLAGIDVLCCKVPLNKQNREKLSPILKDSLEDALKKEHWWNRLGVGPENVIASFMVKYPNIQQYFDEMNQKQESYRAGSK